jgi:hypothetical protein
MANCSIPNSTPATGRISTPSSRQLKKRDSGSPSFFAAFSLGQALSRGIGFQPMSIGRMPRPRTLNAQRSIQRVESWMLDAAHWAFFSIGRVKGAWWPSRSSKPSSLRKRRGRFDSYPLRLFIFDFRLAIFDFVEYARPGFQSQIEIRKSKFRERG